MVIITGRTLQLTGTQLTELHRAVAVVCPIQGEVCLQVSNTEGIKCQFIQTLLITHIPHMYREAQVLVHVWTRLHVNTDTYAQIPLALPCPVLSTYLHETLQEVFLADVQDMWWKD